MKRVLFLFFFFNATFLFASTDLFQSVVNISVLQTEYDFESPWKTGSYQPIRGSGFLIDENTILTNAHVVQDGKSIEVEMQNGQSSYAEVVAVSHSGDLALLRLEDPETLEGIKPLKIRDSIAELNEEVIIVGYPMIGETLCVTQGRVIQTEVDFYLHSMRDLLVHKVDATAFGGNSGGPVFSGSDVVGVLHQGSNKCHEMIPIPVIDHFLSEARTEKVEGYPTFPLYQSTKNAALRVFYQMEPCEGGVLIRYVPENHFLYGEIFPGDIILSVDGVSIDKDQKVKLENGLKVALKYLISQKLYGEYLELTVLREGRRFDLNVLVDPGKKGEPLVPYDRYDTPPIYYVYAGLVFQSIDRQYCRQHDKSHYSDRLDYYRFSGKVEEGRDEIIVLTQILPDRINRGYTCVPDTGIVDTINGRKIKNMGELIETLESHNGIYHQILTEADYEIILDRNEAESRNQKILDRYQIHADRSFNLQ